MPRLTSLIRRIWGGDHPQALTDQQTESNAQIGMLRREFALHPSKGLTPARLYRILEEAERGDLKAQHELMEDMQEKDPQIAADLGKRVQMAAELEWQILPPDDPTPAEQAATDLCAEVFSGIEVEDLVLDLGSAVGHGWTCLEIPWTRDGQRRIPEQPQWRPHAWFRLHPERQDELRLRDHSAEGAELWPLGWLQHRHRSKAGYVARSGLLRVLSWPYLFQNYALGDLAQLLEIYGLPARLGTYPRNATEREKGTLLRAVTSLGHNAAGIIPEGMRIEYLEAAQAKGDPYETMLRWCERAKSRAILGSTLTSGVDEHSTQALGNVHERSQRSLIRADCRQYAGTIARDLLWPIAALNYGIEDRRRAPRFLLDVQEVEDLETLSKALPVFVDLGARIPAWWFHEKSGIPAASESEDILQRRTLEPPPPPAATRQPVAALRAGVPESDAVPAQLERLTQEGDAEISRWIEQIREIVDQVQTLEELRDRIATLDLNPERFADVMAQALAAAHLAGRNDILEGL